MTGTGTYPAPRGARGLMGRATEGIGQLPWPVLVYLICVVTPIGFQAGPLALTTLRLFLIIMIIPLMLRLLAGAYGRVLLTDILFILHILWAAVALTVNNPGQVVQQIGSVGAEFLGGYVIGRAYIRDRASFLALCRALVIIVLVTLPFALFEAQTGRPLIIEMLRALPGVSSVGITSSEPRLGLERVQAVFAHPIHYGLFCSVVLSLAFVALKDVSSTPWRWTSSILVAGCGFLALSSGALLAIVLQLALIVWASAFARVRQRWWLLVAVFSVVYAVIEVLSDRSAMMVILSKVTFSAHNAYWRSIIFDWGMSNILGSVERGIPGSPIFGIGLNDWVRPPFMHSGSMDNFWLVMGARYGVPGFMVLAGGVALAILRIMRRDFSQDPRLMLIRRAWVFTYLGLSFTLSTVHVWGAIYSFVFFMFGAGMWLITAAVAQPQTTPPGPARAEARQDRRAGPRYSRFGPPRPSADP
jgi:hypothetical protein